MTPLSEPLPLRTTAAWADYREPVAIPHRYGECGGALMQYSQDRRLFVWADHAVVAIDAVLIGGQPVSNWAWRNGADSAGAAVAFVEFDQPLEDGAQPIARGRGKPGHGGAAMSNPADVVLDVLANIAGRDMTAARLADFRAACAAAGLEVGGSIERADTLRAVVRTICASVGAVFAEDAAGVCHLWPGPAPSGGYRIGRERELSAGLQLSELANDLTLRYRHEDGQPRGSVQLEAGESVRLYGRRTAVLDAHWLASPRTAVAVATRLLQQQARPAWSVSIGDIPRPLRIGDAVAIDHPLLPLQADAMVLGREFDAASVTSAVRVSVPVGDLPAVRLLRQSAQSEALPYEGVVIETVGSERVLTLREADGRPIVGAGCRLNDNITRTTDGSGRVSFPASSMPPGVHVIVVTTSDGRTFATEVTV